MGSSEARAAMGLHAVVAQSIQRAPLDASAVVAYLALAALAAAATRQRPMLGVALLIALVPFDFQHDLGPTTITFPKVALAGFVAGLLLARCDPRTLAGPSARPLLAAAGLVLLATALSALHAEYRGAVVRETFKAAEYLTLFAAVLTAARAARAERVVRVALAGTLVAVAVLALGQESGGAPSVIAFPGHPIPRIAGPLEGPNQLAGYLGLALPVVLAFALTREPLGLELAALGLGGMALVLTLSRAGTLATLVAAALVFALSPGRRAVSVATVGAGAALGVLVLGLQGYAATRSLAGLLDVILHFSTVAEAQDPGTVGNRSQLWHAALALWKTQPVVGIGAGNFELELGRVNLPTIRTHANSLYLQSLAEGGVVLFSATLALVIASIVTFVRGPFREPLVVGALAASVGFALHQALDLLVFYPKVGELWWILLALGTSRVAAADTPRSEP